ncbi:MAG: hypothetical protein MUP22_05780, partial [Desulfobacterales bacterium]|nr:hypothetical protein [Desulfobacterales bacterium]
MINKVFKNTERQVVFKMIGVYFFTVVIFAMSGAVSDAEVIDRVIAVVNSDIIVLSELNQEVINRIGINNIKSSVKKLEVDLEHETNGEKRE